MNPTSMLALVAVLVLTVPGALGSFIPAEASSGHGNLPFVKYTLDMKNGSRFNGNYASPVTGVASQGEAGIAMDTASGYLYATNLLYNISVIDAKTSSLVRNLRTGGEPFDIAYDASSGNLYATNVNQRLAIINGTSARLQGNISTGAFTARMAMDSVNSTLYLQDLLSLSYEKINLKGEPYISNVSISKEKSTINHPVPGIAYDSSINAIFSSDFENSSIVVLNATTGGIIGKISLESQIGALTYDASSNRIYAAAPGIQRVYEINATDFSVVGNLTTGGYPSSIAVDTVDRYIFVTNELDGALSVFNQSSGALLEALNLSSGSTGAYYSNGTGYLYVVNSGTDLLSIISPGSHAGTTGDVFYVVVPALLSAAAVTAYAVHRNRKGGR